jgi:putative transposase
MANTYTQLYVHVIFAVKGRANLISPKWKNELYKYISGIVSNKNQKLIIIEGMPDHMHLLLGTKPDCGLSDLVRDIKSNSSRYINQKKWILGKFEWQVGFAAFSVGYSQVQMVFNYIKTQEEHHRIKTFKEEYLDLLNAHSIEYKTEYLFEEI